MKRIRLISLVIWGLLLGLAGNSYGLLTYSSTDMGANGDGMEQWQYNFSITNTTPDQNFTEFTVYLDYGVYFSLNNTSTNQQWFSQAAEPYLNVGNPTPGFFNAQISSGILGPGETASDFSVDFVSSEPFAPLYEIYNVAALMESGTSTLATPEPTTWILLSISLGTVFVLRRKLRS